MLAWPDCKDKLLFSSWRLYPRTDGDLPTFLYLTICEDGKTVVLGIQTAGPPQATVIDFYVLRIQLSVALRSRPLT